MTPPKRPTLDVQCPTCYVPVGEWCVRVKGSRAGTKTAALHKNRVPIAKYVRMDPDAVKINAISFADASSLQLLAAENASYVLNRNNYVLKRVDRGLWPGTTFGRRVSEAEGAAAFLIP
jgi:hypothetical protein